MGKVKQKLSALLAGVTGAGLLAGGAVEEAKAEVYYNQYDTLYNQDWNKFYTIWKDPHSTLRAQYPLYSMFRNGFNAAFNQDFGYLLGKASPYQNDATLLFAFGAVGVAISGYLFYKYKKQSKAENPVSKKE